MKILLVIMIALSVLLVACEEGTYTMTSDNGTVYTLTIGNPAKVTSQPVDTEVVTIAKAGATSDVPPISRRVIEDWDGKTYLVNEVYTGETSLMVPGYWIQEGEKWTYVEKEKEFARNVEVKHYPTGGEWGVTKVGGGADVTSIQTEDGTSYYMQKPYLPITIVEGVTSIYKYYAKNDVTGRWYYHEGSKDLTGHVRIQRYWH